MKIIEPKVIIAGMICLTIVECVALFNGINGTIFTIYAGIMGAAIGVFINPKS